MQLRRRLLADVLLIRSSLTYECFDYNEAARNIDINEAIVQRKRAPKAPAVDLSNLPTYFASREIAIVYIDIGVAATHCANDAF